MMTDDLPTIISACSRGDVTEISVFSGDGETLVEFTIARALLDVDALAKRFAAGDRAIAVLP
jgi:hypothetical protein